MYFGHRSIGYADGACYPASTTDRGLAGWDIYYYSPAQCPSGWTGARTATSTFGRDRTYLSLGKETTAVVCCPSGYAYDGSDHQCRSAFTSTTSKLAYISPTTNGNNQWTNTAASNVGTTIAAANPTYNVYGDGVAVWWEQSDLAIFAAASAEATTTSPTTSPTVSPTTTQKVSPTSSPSPSPTGSSGLSTGAKIGIGVGIPLAVIAIGIIGAFVWFRKRGGRAVIPMEMADNKPPEQERTVSELYSDGLYDPHHPRGHHELHGQSIEPR